MSDGAVGPSTSSEPSSSSVGRRPSILVLGTLTLDTVEQPDGTLSEMLGGSAAYAAAGAAAWAQVRLMAVAGPDYPAGALGELSDLGVDTTGLRSSDLPTQRWHARYDTEGERTTVSSDRRILDDFRPTLTRIEERTDALLLGSIHPLVQRHVLEQWRAAHRERNSADGDSPPDKSPDRRPWGRPHSSPVVALDSMSHWVDAYRDVLRSLLPSVTVLFATTDELTALSGNALSSEAAATALLSAGPQVVVEKRGAEGARAFYMDRTAVRRPDGSTEAPGRPQEATASPGPGGVSVVSVPAAPVDVADPTGAGDAFCGAFMAHWVARQPEGHGGKGVDPTALRAAMTAGAWAGARAIAAPSWTGLTTPGG